MIFKKRQANDKIFDSAYKRGDIEFQPMEGDITLDKTFESKFLDSHRKHFEYYTNSQLYENILEIWNDSKWHKVFKPKNKIPKEHLSNIYHDIKMNIDDSFYEHIETFICIAEFLNSPYKYLWDQISTKHKIEILSELNEKFPNRFQHDVSLF